MDHTVARVNDALSTLAKALIPAVEGEDQESQRERQASALELAKSILNNHSKSTELHDINHVSDLIRKKLWRKNDSAGDAIRYGNLYSRLLTLPILTQKWAILYLFHQLSDLDDDEDSTSESESPPRESPPRTTDRNGRLASAHVPEQQRAVPNDASSTRPPNSNSFASDERRRDDGKVSMDRLGPGTAATSEEQAVPPKFQSSSLSLEKAGDSTAPSEKALLRDLPFTLQGLSSVNLSFVSKNTLIIPPTLPLPIVSLLYTLAEPSLLYSSLSAFVESREEGLIGQSLRAAIGIELRSYLGLIATLEGEIRRSIAIANEDDPRAGVSKVGVTLKRCVAWTRDATMGLRLMSLMAEESKSKKGGQLISLIHSFSTSYGDPFVSNFAERMLSHLTRPFYNMLRQWIYDGELSDPYHEFFVIEQDPEQNDTGAIDPRRVPATSVWEDKYKLNDKTVPSIITEDFAKKVFLIGKSLNFIRYGCGDAAWVEAYSKDASKELRYGDTATLESSIDKAYKTTMARLIHLMDTKFKLFEHLNALKKYLLLGQGDFIALLMESLASNLDRPAGSQYRHTLTAQLEHAIRGSNAQFDSSDVHRRLDARLLELEHGNIGWDVFTLEYKVDAPVDVVITPWANKQYLVVFNFLWRIKRVEFALGSTWRRCMTGARGVLASVDDMLGRDWKTVRCCIAEMIHFINQLQYYILFEVIESSWDQLQMAMAKPDCTLDDLIGAHTKYLKAITHKGLLGSTRSSLTGTREDSFTGQLHHILKLMLAYKGSVDGLYSFSVAEFTRRQEFAAKIETRTAQGKWGILDKDYDAKSRSSTPAEAAKPSAAAAALFPERDTDSPFAGPGLAGMGAGDDQMLPALRKRLPELAAEFKTRLSTLLGDLMVQPDVDMKFLGVVMNFNEVYRPTRRKKKDVVVPTAAAVPATGGKGR